VQVPAENKGDDTKDTFFKDLKRAYIQSVLKVLDENFVKISIQN